MGTIAYGCKYHISFSIFGDQIFLSLQYLMIISIFWIYKDEITNTHKLGLFIFFIGFFIVLGAIPSDSQISWDIVMSITIVLNCYLKGPKIIHNFNEKEIGDMQWYTIIPHWIGSAARLYTVCIETSLSTEPLFNLSYMASFFIVTFMLTIYLIYKDQKPRDLVVRGHKED